MPDPQPEPTPTAMRLAKVARETRRKWFLDSHGSVTEYVARALDDAGVRELVEENEKLSAEKDALINGLTQYTEENQKLRGDIDTMNVDLEARNDY